MPEKGETRAVISGVGQSDVGRRLYTPALELTVDAALAAIADAGLRPADIDGRTVLANVPAPAPRALLATGARPAAAVLSGIRPADAAALAGAWADRGLRRDGAWEAGGFACLRLVAVGG